MGARADYGLAMDGLPHNEAYQNGAHGGPPPGGPGSEALALPHNLEAEQAVIGAVLLDNGVYERIGEIVKPQNFFEPLHALIFEKCAELLTSGRLASPVIIGQSLRGNPAFEEAGGTAYLKKLAAAAYAVVSPREYARLVHELALRRELIQIGDEMRAQAFDNACERDSAGQIEGAEAQLFELAEHGTAQRGFEDFRIATGRAIEIAESAFRKSGHVAGLATGLADLDQKLGGFYPSDLIIIAARPGMGKTSLATNIAFNIAKNFKQEADEDGIQRTVNGGVVGFFSLEMASEQLALRILSEQSEIASEKIRKGLINLDEFRKLAQVSAELERIPFYIDQTGSIPISTLAARARRLKRRHGLNLIVIDYLQLMTTSGRKNHDSRVQEVTEITQGLKALAKELNVPVVALSQLSRAVEQRENKRPMLSDLRESGSIEQDADIVLFIYREEYYLESQQPRIGTAEHDEWLKQAEGAHGVAELLIEKHRHGPTGNVRLQFNREFTRFGDLAHGPYEPR
jgi:replicative DNA helicase